MKFSLAQTSDVTISFDGSKISVTVSSLTIMYYVAGNGTDGSIWCDGKSWNPSGSPMENGTITFENVPAGNDYQFKITTGSWNPSWGSANIDAEHSNVTLSGI